MEVFEGNPLHYTYFTSMFIEAVEKRLTRMINLTSREAKKLVKSEYNFENAMRLLENKYGNPHKLLAS